MTFRGATGLPFRAPCGGWTSSPPVLGDCQNNYVKADAKVDRYLNTTKVANYDNLFCLLYLSKLISSCSSWSV